MAKHKTYMMRVKVYPNDVVKAGKGCAKTGVDNHPPADRGRPRRAGRAN